FENAPVASLNVAESLVLRVAGCPVRARCVLLATNAESLELRGFAHWAHPKFTLSVATEPRTSEQISSLGLAQSKPFYTSDLPYLWGRVFQHNRVIFGSGLVHLEDWRELLTLDVTEGHAAELLADLERRVRNLHPALQTVRLSHRCGGPILIANRWQ